MRIWPVERPRRRCLGYPRGLRDSDSAPILHVYGRVMSQKTESSPIPVSRFTVDNGDAGADEEHTGQEAGREAFA